MGQWRSASDQIKENWVAFLFAFPTILTMLLPLGVAWYWNASTLLWFMGACVAVIVNAVLFLKMLDRLGQRRQSRANVAARPLGQVTLDDGALAKSSDPAHTRIYVLHNGRLFAIADYDFVHRAFPGKYTKGREVERVSMLAPDVFKQLPVGGQLMTEQDFQGEFSQHVRQ